MAFTARHLSAKETRDAPLARAALRTPEELERYRQLVELQGDYLSLATRDGKLVYVNAAYAKLHNRRPEDLVGRSFYDFVPEAQRPGLRTWIAEVLRERRPMQSMNQVTPHEGEPRWVQWTNMGFCGADGVLLLHSVGRDIQAQIETEARLRESETRFRLLAESSVDVIIAVDRNLRRTYVSPASREVFGCEPEDLIGREIGTNAHPDDAARLQAEMRALLDGRLERHVTVVRRRHRTGDWIWLEACFRAVRDPATCEITGLVASVRDITARKTAEAKLTEDFQRLETLAGQDALTGLANRRVFDEAIAKALRCEPRLCLIMIDVDHFKAYNDAYGHLAGDEALRRVASAIRPCLRRATDLAARYGGEEFAVLSPGMTMEGGGYVAETIRRAVRDLALPHAGSEHAIVTVSVGVAAAAHDDFARDRDPLIAGADAALYEAKRAGRDRVRLALAPSGEKYRANRE